MCSEQGAGIIPLLALALWVSATTWEFSIEQPVYCHTVTGFEYKGRSADGRPEYDYPERRICR